MSQSVVVPGGGSLTLYQPAEAVLPEGWVGSARIVGDPGSRLAGVVSEVHASGSVAMNYVLGRSLAMTAAAPLVMKAVDGWNASLQVQNPNPVGVGIALSFYTEDGDLVHSMPDAIEPGGSRTYYPPTMPEIPVGFKGSAIVQSTTGQPIAVVVNETSR